MYFVSAPRMQNVPIFWLTIEKYLHLFYICAEQGSCYRFWIFMDFYDIANTG
jgi:hypothetical protein